jgi:hypothetical protein
MSFATANVMSMNALAGSITPFPQRTVRARQMRRSLVVRAEGDKLRETVQGAPGVSVPDNGEKDSYEQLEAPVRGSRIPDGGPPVAERRQDRDDMFIQIDGSAEKQALGNKIAFPNLMRFNGAAPEVINSRLAMLGCVAALTAELTTQTTVFEQFAKAPVPIVSVFVLFSVASLIPMLKGVPRYGGGHWGGIKQFTPDAEITVGRIAMLGFLGIVVNELITKTPAV